MALMVPIKIQCGCGQRYAFQVEPVGGQMPAAVSCPKCGTDGTTAANAVLLQQFQPQPAVAVATANGAPAAARVAVPVGAGSQIRVGAPSAPSTVSIPAPQAGGAAPSLRPTGAPSSVRVSGMAPPAVAAAEATAHAPAPAERKRLPGQLDPDRAAGEARAKIMWGDDPAEITKYLMSQGFSADEAKSTLAPMLADRAQMVRKAGVGRMFVGTGMMLLPVVSTIVCLIIGYFPIKLLAITVAIGIWGGWKFLSGLIMFLSPKSEKGDVADM
ncbi:MAG TPA: hypothetical protein VI282_05670 [Verrucomicrobiae bacterium]